MTKLERLNKLKELKEVWISQDGMTSNSMFNRITSALLEIKIEELENACSSITIDSDGIKIISYGPDFLRIGNDSEVQNARSGIDWKASYEQLKEENKFLRNGHSKEVKTLREENDKYMNDYHNIFNGSLELKKDLEKAEKQLIARFDLFNETTEENKILKTDAKVMKERIDHLLGDEPFFAKIAERNVQLTQKVKEMESLEMKIKEFNKEWF